MARKNSRRKPSRKNIAIGIGLALIAFVIVSSLVTHHHLDDERITGELDFHLSPFEIQFHNQGGMFGAYLSYILLVLFGWLAYFVPAGLFLVSLRLLFYKVARKVEFKTAFVFLVSLLATMVYNVHLIVARTITYDLNTGGGYVAEKLTTLSVRLLGETGSYVILSGLVLIGLILFTSASFLLNLRFELPRMRSPRPWMSTASDWMRAIFTFHTAGHADDPDESEEVEFAEDNSAESDASTDMAYESQTVQPTRTLRLKAGSKPGPEKPPQRLQLESVEYNYPAIDLLKANPYSDSPVSREESDFTARMLKETLETFGVTVDGEIEKFPGPIITRYEFKPGAGIKVNQVVNLSDDLALALKAKRVRIVAPIPGKAAVGVEIPNRHAQTVYLRDIISSSQFQNADLRLPLALGKTIGGQPFVIDLARLPHLLIAGATGSGKSVCINVIISSLLYRLHPYQVRFIMIDPKMLELTVYKGIPHLGRPVVTSPKRAEKVLADSVVEMENRYRRLAEANVRNIEDFNRKQEKDEDKLPYLVIVVDELADLMMASTSSRTELLVTRLAQMARAVGIHLVLATQRPSVDVITGLIKANFPARIAFQVSSKVDSRTIIDCNGAEKLLGAGDMLFLHSSQPEPQRIHGSYLSNEETDRTVKHINDQNLPMFALTNISQAVGEAVEADIDFGDPLFREACEVVVRHKQGSVSLLQRRLGVGYQRAARLIDKLEQAGIVSTFDGSKARDVLVDAAYLETLFSRGSPAPVNTEQN